MGPEQYQKLKEGLSEVVDRLNKEFSSREGKFYLKESNGKFVVLSKKYWYSKPFRWAIIDYDIPDRIGYKPVISNLEPRKLIDEYLEEFSRQCDIRIGTLYGF